MQLPAVFDAAAAALCAAMVALNFLSFQAPQLFANPTTSTQAPLLLDGVVGLLLPLAALGTLFATVAVIYHNLLHRTATTEGAPAGNHRLGALFAVLCASAGTLHLLFFVNPAGVGGDVGAQARALGLAAARLLPAAAAATFFLGMALIIIAHVRAGGEGGGGAVVAADGQIQGPLVFLTKTAYLAAAALAWLVAMAAFCSDTAAIY